ncbi:hypothetical protein Tco_1283019 [Tanacetum coccineum]
MIQQVQNSCQFHGLPGDDANKHLNKFLTVTQSMKQNGVPDDSLRLFLFPYSLTHHAIAWFDRLPKNSILNFEEMVSKFLSKYSPPRWRPEECYDLIENMTAHHNDWDTSAQRGESSRSITYLSPEIAALTQQIAEMNKNFLRMRQSNQQVNAINPRFNQNQAQTNFPSTDEILRQHMIASDAKFQLLANQMTKIEKSFNERPQGVLPSNIIPNPQEDIKAADRVVAPTPGSAITIPETANEFIIKDTENEAVRLMMFPLSLIGKAKTWLDELNEGTIETECLETAMVTTCPKKTVAFASEGGSNSDTDKIMARMDSMTMKMDAQYKDFQSRSNKSNLDDDDIPMSREEEAKFMQTFCRTRFYNDYRDRDSNCDNWRSSRRNDYNRDNYQSHFDDKPNLQKQLSDFIKSQHSTNSFVKDTFMDLKNKLETTTKNLKAKFDRLADKQFGRPSGSLPSNTQPNPKEEDFDALLNEGSEILHSNEGTILEEKLFAEFDKFMAMTADENSESESDTEEPPFEKITFNIDYKIKTSIEEPPMDLELKPLPDNLEYLFLKELMTLNNDNAFNGIDGGDVIDHIAKVLKITEWIKIPHVEKNELRLHVFSKSLSGDVETW